MQGQWIGRSQGENLGTVILDIDEEENNFDGCAFVYADDQSIPSAFARIITKDKGKRFSLKVPLLPIEPRSGDVTSWASLKDNFPGMQFSSEADTEWDIGDDKITIKWRTDIGGSGEAEVFRSHADEPSTYEPLSSVSNWDQFRSYVRGLENYRYIFRGQEDARWRLRTHFHRTRRTDLFKFMLNDIPTLSRHLSNLTRHIFDLRNPDHNGAFFSFVQHHGYPTPLLDWTYSPYIAAYFAFKSRRSLSLKRKVRIVVFDKKQWMSDFNQLLKLAPARPHFSIVETIALNNPRLIPQQALSTVTNIDDIEEYIRTKEVNGKRYLQMIDLPSISRREVMNELSLMGITAGSLFPGIDGVCEQLRERFFDL